ncbi:MAG: hypothetical protein JJ921_03740 [Pseudomonadales bacterium]|nr:hypothetical protein [Pseudomonadales bacterium]MBO6566189.1 hypothetical protein [Pseudomonadales bacterium]MBO6594922.1 hypothetical protein [Pseudomonadales bacterium]MBO6701427.1 hypothetical protein [Pseudomonadales bacterium]MBO6821519.1 hypothetical protein [Pseudomonadales bacterium]
MSRLILLICSLMPLVSEATVQSIDSMDRLFSDDAVPPSEEKRWERTELIGATRVGTRARDQQTWYRFSLARPADYDTQSYSLYFWRYNQSLTLFLNGQALDGDEMVEGFHTSAWNRGRLVTLRVGDWLPGQNVFHVRFQPSIFGGTFSPVKFGLTDSLKPVWQERFFWRISVNEILLGFSLLSALTTLVLWLFRRSDNIYLWFLGITLSWSLVTTHMVIYHNPVPYQYWLPLVHMAIDSWSFFLFGFLNRVLQYRFVRSEKILLVLWGCALMSHAFMPRDYFWLAAYLFHVALLVPIVYLLGRTVIDVFRSGGRLATAVALALLGQILFSGHDLWLFFGAKGEVWETSQHLSQFGVPLLIAVLLITLIVRFTRALGEAEDLNAQLEHRVLEARRALEKSYEEKQRLELDRAAAEERQKIYRDLHDDVGSKLLAISRQEENPAADLAGSALESIREAVYRSNYTDEPLLSFLANMREEVTMRTAAQGIACHWFEDPDLPEDILDTTQCYHLSRILRELVTNSLAHSQCSEIKVSFEVDENSLEDLVFQFSDNGHGKIGLTSVLGSGVNNIKVRAEQIGGVASWLNADGARFELRFSPNFLPGP